MALSNQLNNFNIQDRLAAIEQIIADSLSAFNLSSEYHHLLHTALFPKKDQVVNKAEPKPWGLLPGMCCQAVGGKAEWADTIAASWLLFYAAADLMDSAQDQDDPQDWWSEVGPAVALSAATGLFFCASSILSNAAIFQATKQVSSDLANDFHHSFLQMSSGQYADILNPYPNPAQYWRIAFLKSGSFFGLACRSGARLAVQDVEIINTLGEFGHAFGVLIQILDDLEDLNCLLHVEQSTKVSSLSRSLPFVYALNILPETRLDFVRKWLDSGEVDSQAGVDIYQIVEESGAVIYLLAEMSHYRSLALEKLSSAVPDPAAREILEKLTRSIGSLNHKHH